QRPFTAVEIAAIEPEAGRRRADHAQIRIYRTQRIDQRQIHAVAITRHKLNLIDQQQVALPEPGNVAVQRLDSAKDDLLIVVAAIESVAADAVRSIGPEIEQRLDVLLD